MKFDRIDQAMIEAYRFLAKARKVVNRIQLDPKAMLRSKEMASLKRASLDLSRSLSELRK